jgi:hypothetical protein
MTAKLQEALEAAFAEATRIYGDRGFQRRIGFGRKPAPVNVDLANAWTRPGNPFTCEDMDDRIIPAVQRLLAGFRRYGFPVVHVTTCYQVTDRRNPNTDMGLWHEKIPMEVCAESDRNRLGDRLAHRAGCGRATTYQEARERLSRHLSRRFPARGGCGYDSGDRRDRLGLRASNRVRWLGRGFPANRCQGGGRRPHPRCGALEPVRHGPEIRRRRTRGSLPRIPQLGRRDATIQCRLTG